MPHLCHILTLVIFLIVKDTSIDGKTLKRRETIKIPVQPHLAAFPSPDDDGSYYIVNLSDPPSHSLRTTPIPEDAVQFFLHTKRNGTEEVHEIKIGEENPEWLKHFDFEAPLKILCHGYKSDPDKPFPAEMKRIFMQGNSVNVNIIVTGYKMLTETDWYKEAIKNLGYVAGKTTDMLKYVYNDSPEYRDFKNVHFIGHNLGAHVGGIVGQMVQSRIGKKLGRITGLDPAGVELCDNDNILDASDAELVEVIHTDDGYHCGESWLNISSTNPFFRNWGFGSPLGHVDFYPELNENNPSWKSTQQRPYYCAHCRSYKVLIDLILNIDVQPICDCNSEDSSQKSKCKCGSGSSEDLELPFIKHT